MTDYTPRGLADKPYDAPRRRLRRKRRRARFPGAALYRPARFFKRNDHLDNYRLSMNPRHLGEADWMLYRRPFNPYHPRRRAHQAYEAGYKFAKVNDPKPDWPAITW